MHRNQNFEIVFGRESDLHLQAFRFLELFFHLSFFSFFLLVVAVIDLLLGLLAVKKRLRKHQAFFSMEQPGVVAGNFCSEFFTQLFEHFCAYLRLHSADHSDLGIIGKIFPPAEVEYR